MEVNIRDFIGDRCDGINLVIQQDSHSTYRKWMDKADTLHKELAGLLGPAGRLLLDDRDDCHALAMAEAMAEAYRQGMRDGLLLGGSGHPGPAQQGVSMRLAG